METRQIIKIDEDKCNGCALCAVACHEGAIAMVNGKAKLIREDYCDGLGDCLPSCPTGAIQFETREAASYDEAAVAKHLAKKNTTHQCPSIQFNGALHTKENIREKSQIELQSQLQQWPVQIKLVPVQAPYFENANVLIAADCCAYAYANFHQEFMHNHVTIIGCPKLDEGDYSEKLTQIIQNNNIKSIHILRMEVPCCGGLENAAKQALQNSGKFIPWQVTTISTDGNIIE
ncbi:ferredoxin [Breznakia sp. PF5-3]|uniref:ATP-binding protein n=1 Tax=unclassified Breznakia TaxID=2623764 RepID=UPI0024074174|nr:MULTISPECIES: 4Fe-4S binding protein [unclassified Breznakia]MDF9824646.1 ferredoxin [Breznakia sp. PM6-1]MDF9835631.1 ferredoxin [Breznakia sp. PF5-3]MDF9837704.1 ferredoxin [Breznakia sp. PFB2-8]MDF9859568.1 ferredoxin [Breznakia sp. PH5-24]